LLTNNYMVSSFRFKIDLLHSTNLTVFQLSCHTNVIYSEYPATVFSVIESQNKTVSITTDSLFDLLMLKLSTG